MCVKGLFTRKTNKPQQFQYVKQINNTKLRTIFKNLRTRTWLGIFWYIIMYF